MEPERSRPRPLEAIWMLFPTVLNAFYDLGIAAAELILPDRETMVLEGTIQHVLAEIGRLHVSRELLGPDTPETATRRANITTRMENLTTALNETLESDAPAQQLNAHLREALNGPNTAQGILGPQSARRLPLNHHQTEIKVKDLERRGGNARLLMADTELREDVIVGYITTIREFRCPTATIPRLFLKQKAAHQHTSRGTHWNFVEPGTSFVDNPPSKIYYVARTHPFSLVLLRRSLHRRDETMVIDSTSTFRQGQSLFVQKRVSWPLRRLNDHVGSPVLEPSWGEMCRENNCKMFSHVEGLFG